MGVKTVSQINETIKGLEDKDIRIFPDMTLLLLNGQEKNGYSIHRRDERFFVEFIKWYISKINGEFKYEKFYDFITSFRRFGKHKELVEFFFDEFKRDILKSTSPVDGIHSYFSRFSDYFNKLIAILLQSKNIMKMLN